MKQNGFDELCRDEMYQVEGGNIWGTAYKWLNRYIIVASGKSIPQWGHEALKRVDLHGSAKAYSDCKAGFGPVHP